MMHKVGDKVVTLVPEYIGGSRIAAGSAGIICKISGIKTIGVDFGRNINGHNCGGTCPTGRGWFFTASEIRLVTDDIDFDDSEHPVDKVDLSLTVDCIPIIDYKSQWKYNDGERPVAVCYDCRMGYEKFQDLKVSDDLWELINPTYHKGAGLLCPTCIANRLHYLGKWYNLKLENKQGGD